MVGDQRLGVLDVAGYAFHFDRARQRLAGFLAGAFLGIG
jgi:hypothetical protein